MASELRPMPYMPNLRPTVDIKLESDWHNAIWSSVATIAAQRHRSTKDPYYLAVEIVARSWNLDRLEQNAGRDAVEQLVKDNVTIKDTDILDLYEYACALVPLNYEATLGELRMRLVKAAPKDLVACQRCLDATLANFDWVHSQQIAALMDRNFPNDRKMLFRNIMSTHVLTLTPACPAEKKMLFQTLTKRMIDKAFNQRFEEGFDSKKPGRALLTEGEFDLWCEIILSGSKADVVKALKTPPSTPMKLLRHGYVAVVRKLLKYLADVQEWVFVSELCQEIISAATEINSEDAKALGDGEASPEKIAEVHSKRDANDNCVLSLGSEWFTWSLFIQSSQHQENPDSALQLSVSTVEKAYSALESAHRLTRSHTTYHDLANLHSRFILESPSEDSNDTRLIALATHVVNNYRSPSIYDETQSLIEKLSPGELNQFIDILDSSLESDDTFKQLALSALRLRINFSSVTRVAVVCPICGLEPALAGSCETCLRKIAISALQNYKTAMLNTELREKTLPKESVDPISDFAVISAAALLKLGNAGEPSTPGAPASSALSFADMQLVLQAVVLLEAYFVAVPKNDALRMMLVKLYLLLGCVSRAKTLWDSFGVKNAVLDSLAPIFYDRLSTFAPHFFASVSATDGVPSKMSPLVNYFDIALRRTYPRGLKDAMEYDSYSSILGLYGFYEKLKKSCSMAMVRVESRRGRRTNHLRNPHCVNDDQLLRDVHVANTLSDITDFNCLPNLGCRGSTTMIEMLNLGPPQSNVRIHLGLIAERFIDVISYTQPKEYKPAKPSIVLVKDHIYALERTEDLLQQFDTIANRDGGSRKFLTGPEHSYHSLLEETMSLYITLLKIYMADAQTPLPPVSDLKSIIDEFLKSIIGILRSQERELYSLDNKDSTASSTLRAVSGLHGLGMLRESTTVLKFTVSSLTTILEKIKVIDKARANKDLAWVEKPLKDLKTTAHCMEDNIKSTVKSLGSRVSAATMQGQLRELVVTKETVGGDATGDEDEKKFREEITGLVKECSGGDARLREWAANVQQSWKELMGGWAGVQYLP